MFVSQAAYGSLLAAASALAAFAGVCSAVTTTVALLFRDSAEDIAYWTAFGLAEGLLASLPFVAAAMTTTGTTNQVVIGVFCLVLVGIPALIASTSGPLGPPGGGSRGPRPRAALAIYVPVVVSIGIVGVEYWSTPEILSITQVSAAMAVAGLVALATSGDSHVRHTRARSQEAATAPTPATE